jgi:FKBP-type peptidyl-prolyl cis-trans isomerase SlyD
MENLVIEVTQDVVVSLDYVLTVDGQVVDSTQDAGPIQFLQGHHNIIAGLESRLTGMTVGETRSRVIPAAEAYGEYSSEALADVPRSQFPPDFDLQIGGRLRVRDENGRVLNAVIAMIGADSVRLDLNHPLAGKDLAFEATVVALRPGTPEEIENGRLGCASCGSSQSCDGSCG